jgi:hypothetical protein
MRTNVAWVLNGGWRGHRVHRLAVIIIDCFETAGTFSSWPEKQNFEL